MIYRKKKNLSIPVISLVGDFSRTMQRDSTDKECANLRQISHTPSFSDAKFLSIMSREKPDYKPIWPRTYIGIVLINLIRQNDIQEPNIFRLP